MVSEQSSRRPAGTTSVGNEPKHALQVATAEAIAHHGELLQGVFEGSDGRLHRGLLTLPFPSQYTRATLWPSLEPGVRTRPLDRNKARRAVALTFDHLRVSPVGGDLTLESSIAMGHGYGSSTADVVAAIRAAAMAANVHLRRSTVSRLAVEAEDASDAIIYEDRPVLFAHREGFILEHFGDEFPPLIVVGFRDGAASTVNTLSLPPARYDSEEIELFRVLRGLASRSIRYQDPSLLGRVATLSARISQRHLPKPGWQRALELTEAANACGLQVAHSGTLFGILFDGEAAGVRAQASKLVTLAQQAGFAQVQSFALNLERSALE